PFPPRGCVFGPGAVATGPRDSHLASPGACYRRLRRAAALRMNIRERQHCRTVFGAENQMPLRSVSWTRSILMATTVVGLAALGACGGGAGMHRSPANETAGGTAIGVNAYLWRATLDTLAFMPLASADPYGGVVITDWYVNPEKTDERFKCTVYILDTRLRGDALKVTVFKEVSNGV